MDIVYWVSLIVGGFFVLLSIMGGGDSEADADFDADADIDVDADVDVDAGFDADADHDLDAGSHWDTGSHVDTGGSPDLVDLFTIRALFLFAAFFGLTGVLLSWTDQGEPMTAVLSVLTGLVVGLGGNYVIKRVGYAHISSSISTSDLKGRTGKVLIPFDATQQGKISLVSKGQRVQLIARSFEGMESFDQGDEVVVVRLEGSVAEVVRPD